VKTNNWHLRDCRSELPAQMVDVNLMQPADKGYQCLDGRMCPNLFQHGRPTGWKGCQVCGVHDQSSPEATHPAYSISSRNHLHTIRESANAGCQTCNLLVAGMERYRLSSDIPDSEFRHPRMELAVQEQLDLHEPRGRLTFDYGMVDPLAHCAWRKVEFYTLQSELMCCITWDDLDI
jgi:hypothetical protein